MRWERRHVTHNQCTSHATHDQPHVACNTSHATRLTCPPAGARRTDTRHNARDGLSSLWRGLGCAGGGSGREEGDEEAGRRERKHKINTKTQTQTQTHTKNQTQTNHPMSSKCVIEGRDWDDGGGGGGRMPVAATRHIQHNCGGGRGDGGVVSDERGVMGWK